ncbi:hypothetical protein B0J11DRAFT_582091 [Dendryphion nanum]|uniref:Uncharacterized protein n=1 Tax=Dendryphion nanum TaxID=256645 RepID=A0A9P9IG97_9PLEO|nr:hypothetical protein B0J11DRAFT_582091 [Dendryphion nanum]
MSAQQIDLSDVSFESGPDIDWYSASTMMVEEDDLLFDDEDDNSGLDGLSIRVFIVSVVWSLVLNIKFAILTRIEHRY